MALWRMVSAAALAAAAFMTPASPAPGPASPNVVFLTVDTLRADHLGCYGYERQTSPNLDRFAEESLLFEDFICEEPQTGPSFCAMLASRFPRMMGTIRNSVPLPPGVPTVTQQFKAAGYQTAAVLSNWNLKRALSGLDRGFDVYDDDFGRKRFGLFKTERDADEVTRRAIAWLGTRDMNRPFFLWVHYMDPHGPYRFHNKFNPANRPPRTFSPIDRTRMRYDSEVAYTDHHIQKILDALPKANTHILFTADHGESLHEHNYLGHTRRVYQTTLHIPLMIRGPNIEPGRSNVPARGIDIGPTLLALAGLEPFPGMLGANLLATEIPPDRVRVVETYGGPIPKTPEARSALVNRPSKRQAVISKGWKLITNGPEFELFDLATDPKEEQNLASTMPQRVAQLRDLIETWNVQVPRTLAPEAELSEEDIKALEALGYL